MIILTIDDFKSKPTIVEYLSLYIVSSALIITASASIFGNLAQAWMWLSCGLILLILAVSSINHQLRIKRAQLFYLEWANSLNEDELYLLQSRLQAKSPELALLKKLRYTSC